MRIPCGKDGFLYAGACSDSCGSPYWEPARGSHDASIGHECCGVVAWHYKALLDALANLRAVAEEIDQLRAHDFPSLCDALCAANHALRAARGDADDAKEAP